jgi:type I restriction enzyme S subunit
MSATSAGRLVPSDEFFNKRVYSAELSKYLLVPPWSFAYNPSRANIGSIGLNASSVFGAVSPVYVVAQSSTPASAWWVELALRTPSVRAAIDAYSSGSVRQVLRFEDFASIEIPLPCAEGIDTFYADSQILLEKTEQVQDENLALHNTRDVLLPELLSGRLRVRDAEKVVEGRCEPHH